MRMIGWGLATAGLLLLAACGGRKSGAVAGQADLLAEDDVVASPAQAGGLPPAPGEPKAATALTAGELVETRCLGFLPEGGLVYINLEERQPGEKGPTRIVRTMVTGPKKKTGHGLPVMETGRMAPDEEAEDEMFGDGLELEIGDHVEAINAAITGNGMLACQNGADLEMGAGGFRREVREVIAFPEGKPFKVTFRDNAVFAGPADGAARQFAEAPADDDAQYKLSDVWFTTKTPGIVAIISDASSEQARRIVVHIPTRAPAPQVDP